MFRPSRLARPLQRRRLERAARRYVDHRWPVVPGARLSGDRFDCDQIGCPTVTCHPALADWETAASLDPVRIADWWERTSYGVLLATGYAFDVLEVAGPLGRRLAREVTGPVAIAPPQRWMFLVAAGDGIRPELADRPCVVLHHGGSWIPAPPTPLPGGAVRWVSRPRGCDWAPADPDLVQRTAARLLGTRQTGTRQTGTRQTGTRQSGRHLPDEQPRQVWQLNRTAVRTAE